MLKSSSAWKRVARRRSPVIITRPSKLSSRWRRYLNELIKVTRLDAQGLSITWCWAWKAPYTHARLENPWVKDRQWRGDQWARRWLEAVGNWAAGLPLNRIAIDQASTCTNWGCGRSRWVLLHGGVAGSAHGCACLVASRRHVP